MPGSESTVFFILSTLFLSLSIHTDHYTIKPITPKAKKQKEIKKKQKNITTAKREARKIGLSLRHLQVYRPRRTEDTDIRTHKDKEGI